MGRWMSVAMVAAALANAPMEAQAQGAAHGAAPDAERARLAHEVVQAAGGVDKVSAVLRQALDAAQRQVAVPGSASAQQKAKELQAFMRDRLVAAVPEMLAATEGVYAGEFTADQLRDMLAFYRSPTGQVVVQKLPAIAQESMVALRPTMVKLQRDLLRKMCELSACTAQQRTQLDALNQTPS